MSKVNLERSVFSLFSKSVMLETVRKSAGIKSWHVAGPEKEKTRSPNVVRSRGVT